MQKDFRYREIPYNYTSFSDKEIVLKYFDIEVWEILKSLREHRKTGRSARLLFEIYGDYFIIDRNPYIFNNFLENGKKLRYLEKLHERRLSVIEGGASSSGKIGDLVLRVLERTREVDRRFFANFEHVGRRQKKVLSHLSGVTDRGNIKFNAFHKVSHATDATDWRIEIPFLVVYPDSVEELGGIVSVASSLSFKVIPRGAGTGLTGAAVPVVRDTMVVNTEKLNRIGGIEYVRGAVSDIPVIVLESGVVTQDAMDFAKARGFIFATDPTSAWACTVGGNLAMNSGGKKAVIWGTAVDNVYSFRMVVSGGIVIEVVRRNHPCRKIQPLDDLVFDVYDVSSGSLIKEISLRGSDVRKPGLGKDITNKALEGVPGIQKEGGDGIIVSCKFVLHKPFLHKRTLCLEFFGNNMLAASQAIVSIKDLFEFDNGVYLTALEHFDDKYVKAIVYKNKSGRVEEPKAVLLIDIESDDEDVLLGLVDRIMLLTGKYNTESILASSVVERERFWKDRKNLGAIAKDTNAFKLNEDVVIGVDKLPIFADFVDNLNMRKDLISYISILAAIEVDLLANISSFNIHYKGDTFLFKRISSIGLHISSFRDKYELYRDNLNESAGVVFAGNRDYEGVDASIFDLLRDGRLPLDFEGDCIDFFRKSFYGYNDIIEALEGIVSEHRRKKVVVATHMHAGDGNIHVNIPVHSNDYDMMQEANETVALVIGKTKELGGVISGEHGIGLTKLEFLDDKIFDDYALYKKGADPDNLFNPGKLSRDLSMDLIYTPSFNLLELEAFILKVTDLEDLSLSIAPCLRCGRCKGVCNTHYPGATIFYNPRNKVQGVALIVEAVLYDAQVFNELSFRHFNMLRDISNHCTLCHKCEHPCPVNIDFGEVTLAIRKLLVDRKKKKFKLMTWLTLNYLRTKGYYVNRLLRLFFLKAGFKAQSIGHYINKPFSRFSDRVFPKISYMLKSPYPSAGAKDIRELLGLKGDNTFFSFQSSAKGIKKAVFYFPGCGSERMFPEISIASIALLYYEGVQVIIPPLYLCCGFPFLANGETELADLRGYENRVVFHKIAETMSYARIKDIIISCGTCYEMLYSYDLSNIFEGSMLVDINEFIIREGFLGSIGVDEELLYHDPCHSPIKGMSYDKAFDSLFSRKVVSSPNCCGDGGTLALSTPILSHKLRERKQNFIKEDVQASLSKHSFLNRKETVLTTCPSCVQGLSKINNGVKVRGKHLAVFLAEKTLGRHWQKDFIKELRRNKDAIEHILI